MIRYRLVCAQAHEFDAWFRDSATFARQSANGDVLCPHCGDSRVQKALMTPGLVSRESVSRESASRESVSRDRPPRRQEAETPAAAPPPQPPAQERRRQLAQALARRHIEQNFEYQGDAFPDEARRIHKGEAPARNIYGKASAKQVSDLADEGIEVLPMPGKPHH